MSQYLIIKKNDVTIGEWSRSTIMYQACSCRTYTPTPFDVKSCIDSAIEYVQDSIKQLEVLKEDQERIFTCNLTYTERCETLATIHEIEESIEQNIYSLHILMFIQNCWKCDCDKANPPVWTWYIN